MTRLEELATAVLDGSARDHEVKEMARLVLEAEQSRREVRDALNKAYEDTVAAYEAERLTVAAPLCTRCKRSPVCSIQDLGGLCGPCHFAKSREASS